MVVYYAMVGYSNGFVKIFQYDGQLVFAHKWHSSAVKKLKVRQMLDWATSSSEADEFIILYHDKKLISVDGNALWIFLRNEPKAGSLIFSV
jgi:hypothetical protein